MRGRSLNAVERPSSAAAPTAASRTISSTASGGAISAPPGRRFRSRRTALSSVSTSSRSASRGSLPISRRSFTRSAFASASEKVVSSTRLSGLARARWTARCSATMVFPVPADPAIRAGPLKRRSTSSRCAGWRNIVHFSQGYSSARASSSRSLTIRNRRCASGCSNGPTAGIAGRARGVPPVASSSSASAASPGRWSASSSSVSSVACRTKKLSSL